MNLPEETFTMLSEIRAAQKGEPRRRREFRKMWKRP
jgi:hypothetical protein